MRPTVSSCLSVIVLSTSVIAQDFIDQHVSSTTDSVMRVDEEWEMIIGEPDPRVCGPQATCAMSPIGHADALHAIFNFNHRTLPDFVPGGIQLQVWHGEQPVVERKHHKANVLSVPGEVIRWTQRMSLDSGALTFSIVDGSSTSWGAFGGQGYLSASVLTSLANLNNYDPAVSAKHSGVVFAANRVKWLKLRRIHAHTESGEVYTIDINAVVK